jgi:oligopeptidase B
MKRLAIAALLVAGCGGGTTPKGADHVKPPPPLVAPTPPVAAQRPHDVVSANGTRNDPYYWLRDDTRKDPDVLAYLDAENVYTAAIMKPAEATQQALIAEMRARIKEDDGTVPIFDDGYWYYTRYEAGKQYPIHARRKAAMTAAEEVVLDGNALATGHTYYSIGTWQVSRDGARVAWAEDTVGRRQYTLRVKDLATGELLADTATQIAPDVEWSNDGTTLFYVGKDPVTLREDRVFRHVLGRTGADELVHQEADGSYYTHLQRSKSRRYLLIELEATTNTEYRLVDLDKPAAAPTVFLPRSKDHEYHVDHLDKTFFIRTNSGAKNFQVVKVAAGKQRDRKAWKPVIPHDPERLVSDFVVYRGFVAADVRTGGLAKLWVVPTKGAAFYVTADDPTYTMGVRDTPDAASTRLRYTYDSMVAPTSTFELDVTTGEKELLKQDQIPTYDPSLYTSEYLHATAADGAAIPISVVYKKTTPRDGTAPLWVYGYGSYGSTSDAELVSRVVSLLDRGFVYAIAHVRGGQELGRAWYEAGKLMHKRNTFTDFIAVTEHLVANRYGARDQVFAEGGSAGGLLMGAIANLRPDLYRGVVAYVPFVDVVTTMLDETIPLTTNEFDEWGNPKDKAAYDYMLAYSPYDNVTAQAYPSMFVHTGLWDSQVQYFEPAKWVARLRATKTDGNLVAMYTDMTSGHGGASGRFDKLQLFARALAFALMVRERPDARPGWPAAAGAK